MKLLGVALDYKLNFESHISNLCKKAASNDNKSTYGTSTSTKLINYFNNEGSVDVKRKRKKK